MSHEADSSSGALDAFYGQATDLIFNWANAKIAAEKRPPATGFYPKPVYPPLSTNYPDAAMSAQGSDIGQQIGEIMAAPRTWLALGAIAVLVFVFVKMRR